MEKKSFVLVAAFSLLMTVGTPTAHAYLSPSQVFGVQGGSTSSAGLYPAAPRETLPPDRTDLTTTEPPASERDAAYKIAQQQLASQLRREAEQKALFGTGEEKKVMLAEEETDTSLGLLGSANDQAGYDLRMARMEEKGNGNVTIVIGSNGQAITMSDGQVLHSGAPSVTATGPETVLMLALLILAGVSTLFYVHIRRKRFV